MDLPPIGGLIVLGAVLVWVGVALAWPSDRPVLNKAGEVVIYLAWAVIAVDIVRLIISRA